LAFLLLLQAGDEMAVLQDHVAEVKRRIDVAVRIDHVFDKTIDAALVQPGKVRADLAALAFDLVTYLTVLYKDFLPRIGIEMRRRAEGGATPADLLLDLLLGREYAFGQFLQPRIKVRHLRSGETVVNRLIEQEA